MKLLGTVHSRQRRRWREGQANMIARWVSYGHWCGASASVSAGLCSLRVLSPLNVSSFAVSKRPVEERSHRRRPPPTSSTGSTRPNLVSAIAHAVPLCNRLDLFAGGGGILP